MPISRLLYSSVSRLEPGALTIDRQITRIAGEAALLNEEAGITGILVFVEDQFIQILEGETEVVEEIFERICCDFRHAQVRLIDLVSVKERLFDRWHMARLCEGDDPGSSLDDDLRNIRYLLGVNARVAVERMHETLLSYEEVVP